MTEKEKMLTGLLYFSSNKELTKERLMAKELVHQFNISEAGSLKKRMGIIRQLFGKTNGGFLIEPPFYCDYGYNIEIGKQFFSNFNLIILDCAKVTIGNHVFIGPNVSIYTATHPLDPEKRRKGLESAHPVGIGNDVWLGGNVVVNPGVTIGEKSVIGAGSVVTRSIPANVLAVGNPCRVIRELSDEKKRYS